MAEPHPNKSDGLTPAQHIFDQWLMLWNDQVDLAKTLHEKRRTYSLGFVLIGGLGLFKLDWYRRADAVATIPPGADRAVAIALLITVLVVFMISAYAMFTERATLRPIIARISGLGDRAARGWIPTFGWAVGEDDQPAVAADQQKLGRRAISALAFTPDESDVIFESSSDEVWRLRAFRLSLAYSRLALANRRVEQRIKTGLFCMIVGYVIAGALVILYALAQA